MNGMHNFSNEIKYSFNKNWTILLNEGINILQEYMCVLCTISYVESLFMHLANAILITSYKYIQIFSHSF